MQSVTNFAPNSLSDIIKGMKQVQSIPERYFLDFFYFFSLKNILKKEKFVDDYTKDTGIKKGYLGTGAVQPKTLLSGLSPLSLSHKSTFQGCNFFYFFLRTAKRPPNKSWHRVSIIMFNIVESLHFLHRNQSKK